MRDKKRKDLTSQMHYYVLYGSAHIYYTILIFIDVSQNNGRHKENREENRPALQNKILAFSYVRCLFFILC